MDFNSFAAAKETYGTSTTNRPVKQIRANLKTEALNKALEVALRHIVDCDGLVMNDNHYELSQEDRVFAIRTTYNSIFGPELSYDKESAARVYEMLAGVPEEDK